MFSARSVEVAADYTPWQRGQPRMLGVSLGVQARVCVCLCTPLGSLARRLALAVAPSVPRASVSASGVQSAMELGSPDKALKFYQKVRIRVHTVAPPGAARCRTRRQGRSLLLGPARLGLRDDGTGPSMEAYLPARACHRRCCNTTRSRPR